MHRYLVLIPGITSCLIQWADSRASAAAGAAGALGLTTLPAGATAVAIAANAARFEGCDANGMAVYSSVSL